MEYPSIEFGFNLNLRDRLKYCYTLSNNKTLGFSASMIHTINTFHIFIVH